MKVTNPVVFLQFLMLYYFRTIINAISFLKNDSDMYLDRQNSSQKKHNN
jgi:hypothetical protein